MISQERGWSPEGTIPPHWHYFDSRQERSLCGDVWLPIGQERPWMETLMHQHPLNCVVCERLARTKYEREVIL